jgi:hypothetical protein
MKMTEDETVLLLKRPLEKAEWEIGDTFCLGSRQIKTHFGKALVKMLEEKARNPDASLGIAHPDDADIKWAIGGVTPLLKTLGIKHFWVSQHQVIEE